ncbi:MAG: hypothetical protein GC180_07630 [Bacteroidetes bacterium]|nr:hypothetical protein [Bacteroidota bacterium]
MSPLEIQLNALGQLPKSEVPPFLLTRIKARLEEKMEYVRPAIAWSAIAGVLILLAVNIIALRSQQHSDAEQIISTMHLNSSNSLYQ